MEMIKKYWWAIAAALVLWFTMGTKTKRKKSRARLRGMRTRYIARRSARRMRRRGY